MTRPADRLRREEGQALVSALLLLAGVLAPLLFLVPLFARVEEGRLAAAHTARAAVRSAVTAPSPAQARRAAQAAVARSEAKTGVPLRLALAGQFARGSILRAEVSADIPLGGLPGLGHFGAITVRATAAAPVDRYRSLRTEAEP